MAFPLTIITREAFESHPLFSRLLELHDVPDKLYIAGTLPDIKIDEYGRAMPRILTIVGSRSYTSYGKLAVEKLVASLQGQKVIIISGLALGIDTIAHRAALDNSLITIAIPGSGLDHSVLYPRSHVGVAEEIVLQGGCLISEFDPMMPAAQWTFPARNRIKAALADAVLIAQASEKSGTLITARLALELGKDIGAVPGDIFSDAFKGTNMLIKEGAYMIRNEDDLFDLLHLSRETKEAVASSYSKEERALLDLLLEPMEKDALLIKAGLPPDQFLMTLSSLEMKGCVQETFGELRKVV
jgi:DNA processing protein